MLERSPQVRGDDYISRSRRWGDVDVATKASYADLRAHRVNLIVLWQPPEGWARVIIAWSGR